MNVAMVDKMNLDQLNVLSVRSPATLVMSCRGFLNHYARRGMQLYASARKVYGI